jgi:hypothetical protein
MRNFTALLVFIHLVLVSNTLLATNYYLSSSGNDSYSGTSKLTPWKTLSKLDSMQFQPGDTIHFKKGDEWLGRFKITESGSAINPICFTSYGEGDFPQLSNPNWDYTWDGGVIRVLGSYIVVEEIHFIDGAAHPYEEDKAAHENVYDMGAINLTKQSKYCTVQYCEFEDYPIGVQSQGQHNKIFQNYFHDCNKGMCLPFWGPIAIFSGGLYDEISYNYVINYKGGGFGGFDGGAIEIDHFMWGDGYIGYGADSIKIHHNISIENAGFLEPEALNNTKGNNYIEIYNNFSDDYKWFISDDDLNYSTVRNNTSLRILPWQKSLEFTILIQGVENKVLHNLFIVANSLTTYVSEAAAADIMARYPYYVHQGSVLERKHNIYYCHDQSVLDPIGRMKNETEEVLSSWEKLAPPIYDSSGAVLRPQPDNNGIIRAWVPTDKKFEFESFTIMLPQSMGAEDVYQSQNE